MILLSGISKSGKTHTLREAMSLDPELRGERASAILRELGRPLEDLSPDEVAANQMTLLDALDALPSRVPSMLLDGHALIETAEGPVMLSEEVFDRLDLSGIVVVEERPEIVAARRQGGDLEVQPDWIRHIQSLEREHCERQGRRLGIPCLVVRSGDACGLLDAVRSISGNRCER